MTDQNKPGGGAATAPGGPRAEAPTRAAIERWLVDRIAQELELRPSAIDVKADMSRLGLDSALAVSLSVDLGAYMGMKLSATLVWDYPTIEELAGHVADLAANPGAGASSR